MLGFLTTLSLSLSWTGSDQSFVNTSAKHTLAQQCANFSLSCKKHKGGDPDADPSNIVKDIPFGGICGAGETNAMACWQNEFSCNDLKQIS